MLRIAPATLAEARSRSVLVLVPTHCLEISMPEHKKKKLPGKEVQLHTA